jgi:CHASE3 domain sensor protein
MFGEPMSERMKAMRNLIAERALRRGRALTATEQLDNLADALGYGRGELRSAIDAAQHSEGKTMVDRIAQPTSSGGKDG